MITIDETINLLAHARQLHDRIVALNARAARLGSMNDIEQTRFAIELHELRTELQGVDAEADRQLRGILATM